MNVPDVSLARVRSAAGQTVVILVRGDANFVPTTPGAGTPFADVGELLAREDWMEIVQLASLPFEDEIEQYLLPTPAPSAVFCVGHNFRAHLAELGRPIPSSPTLFMKLARALVGPEDEVRLPSASTEVDYEGEVVLVIGAEGRNVPADQAWHHIAGVTLMNDVSLRDFQNRSSQWLAGKTWERSTPVGPMIRLLDAAKFAQLQLETYVSGERRQSGALGDLIFGPAELIADLSQIVTLMPGDLIATGTPGGVGMAADPTRFLRDGDECEVRVSGVGLLKTRFVAE